MSRFLLIRGDDGKCIEHDRRLNIVEDGEPWIISTNPTGLARLRTLVFHVAFGDKGLSRTQEVVLRRGQSHLMEVGDEVHSVYFTVDEPDVHHKRRNAKILGHCIYALMIIAILWMQWSD